MKNELSKVLKIKQESYDEIAKAWMKRNAKGESLIEHLDEQWRGCDRAPSMFDFLDEAASFSRMGNNEVFLSKKFPGLYVRVVIYLFRLWLRASLLNFKF